ncbi:MAG: phenylacetate--CoA ligase family protein, partial [Gammaproteobacteria bacterium]|nr:phenylacetate--CoA ligase family protein [Gammaproteobacteria bacterium]
VLTQSWFKAANLHNYLLHGLDLTAPVGVIRGYPPGTATVPDGITDPKWASGLATGPGYRLNIREPIAEQLAWLARRRPRYLLTYPSNLEAMAAHVRQHAIDVSFIEHVHTIGEALRPETRALAEAAFACTLVDTYSSVELGLLAWQCPGEDYYLAAAATHYIEILRDDGEPCVPGESGRVVITPLHNFATPMIRYANGDIAEVGEPCRHGRALPVIRRIMGRERNMLMLADGARRWMMVSPELIGKYMPIVRAQILQTALDRIEVRVQLRGELPEGAEARCTAAILADMPGHYSVAYRYEDEIDLGPGGKFEDFVCQVPPGGSP